MSAPFDAWFWPHQPADTPRTPFQAGELDCRRPPADGEWVTTVARRLRHAGEALGNRTVSSIITSVDGAAARLADPADSIRQEAETLLQAATGYSPAMTTLVLDRMTAGWRASALEALVEAEMGAAALDGFAPRGTGDDRARAYGPRLAFQVFAGNVPGVAVTAIIRMLLVKAPSLGKLAADQPVLPVLFARALHSVDRELAGALALTYWPGGSEDVERAALEAADLVVVYGGREASASFSGRILPHSRLVLHGPRFSIGLVGTDADLSRTAQQVALAVATFDQHGCVSPHALWVEGDAERFAEAVADAFDQLEDRLPRGRITAGEASAIQQERGAAEMRGQSRGGRVLSSQGTRWTVVYDPDPSFRPSCLNRFLRIHPTDSLDDVPERLAAYGTELQSAALACAPDRRETLAHALARAGATRITTFDRIPWPPPTWHHDGHPPLGELVRWVDLES